MTQTTKLELFAIVLWLSASTFSAAQAFKTIALFDGVNGEYPANGSLVQGVNGNLYGTTSSGGAENGGTVFEIAGGKIAPLYSLCSLDSCADGFNPQAGLVQAANGNLYGTTFGDEFNLFGTVFEVTPGGRLATLYTFCPQGDCANGSEPEAGLIQAPNGNFYGTTVYGGTGNYGAVFEMTPGGKLITVHSFTHSDGEEPSGNLIQGSNGNFYGTTHVGGANNYGTVFEMTAAGALLTLHSFANTPSGAYPSGGLVQAANGNFYGTTSQGGANNQGTVFEITPSGRIATLYSFCAQENCVDGAGPQAGLVQATDGNFYGTTQSGGAYGHGAIFGITAGGKFVTLHSFCAESGCPDGWSPLGGLLLASDGNLYGTTYSGGLSTCYDGCGTVFSLSLGLTR
jgi:uncharacterized repeat protein (TIGR03803 family)